VEFPGLQAAGQDLPRHPKCLRLDLPQPALLGDDAQDFGPDVRGPLQVQPGRAAEQGAGGGGVARRRPARDQRDARRGRSPHLRRQGALAARILGLI